MGELNAACTRPEECEMTITRKIYDLVCGVELALEAACEIETKLYGAKVKENNEARISNSDIEELISALQKKVREACVQLGRINEKL